MRWFPTGAALLACAAPGLKAAGPDNVLVVVNDASALSRTVGEYYTGKRHVPLRNICHLHASLNEEISRTEYDRTIAQPLGNFLRAHHLVESILFIAMTAGVPLKISGTQGAGGDAASVDSELTLLYADLHGLPHRLQGGAANPFFGHREDVFRHPQFPMYLVTRLAGYDFPDIRGIIDRALAAHNAGKFVIDLKENDSTHGNAWLRAAATLLPHDRVVLDETSRVLEQERAVIAYASWGSNDPARKNRHLRFGWLPGAIVTEYVSTNARTFARPPDGWTLGTWADPRTWFAGAPQTMTADYLHDGATGASGHVYEPFLEFTPRPDLVLPAYYHGRTLGESFWLGIPVLSWMNVVIGDPLCTLGAP